MNDCACGCGETVKKGKTWVRGHHFRHRPLVEPNSDLKAIVEALKAIPDGPPAHPLPINRARWRLAEDRPGTSVTNPWIKTKCHSCLNEMWTRDELSRWEHGGLCEECGWLARENMGDLARKQFQQMARKPWDPFQTQ